MQSTKYSRPIITEKERRVVRDHYKLSRPVSDAEVQAEIANLIRRRDTGLGWFDMDAMLAARLGISA